MFSSWPGCSQWSGHHLTTVVKLHRVRVHCLCIVQLRETLCLPNSSGPAWSRYTVDTQQIHSISTGQDADKTVKCAEQRPPFFVLSPATMLIIRADTWTCACSRYVDNALTGATTQLVDYNNSKIHVSVHNQGFNLYIYCNCMLYFFTHFPFPILPKQ